MQHLPPNRGKPGATPIPTGPRSSGDIASGTASPSEILRLERQAANEFDLARRTAASPRERDAHLAIAENFIHQARALREAVTKGDE